MGKTKIKAAKIQKEKQEARQKMIDEQTAYLEALKCGECARIENQKQEAENIERLKREKQRKLLEECERYRVLQLERKEQEKKREWDEDMRLGKLALEDRDAYEK